MIEFVVSHTRVERGVDGKDTVVENAVKATHVLNAGDLPEITQVSTDGESLLVGVDGKLQRVSLETLRQWLVGGVQVDAATKEYVDALVEQVRSEAFKSAAKIACLVSTISGSEQRTNLKLTPFAPQNEDYSLTCSGYIPVGSGQYFRLEPPPGYAFTGLAYTWVPAMKIDETYRIGALNADGAITFTLNPSDVGKSFTFVSVGNLYSSPARFILEVA